MRSPDSPAGMSSAISCRVCQQPVSADALTCPHCQAPRPARAEFTGEGYEWRSTSHWLGSPLVHIAFGMDADGRPRVARGIVAIGQRARGGVAIGVMATGIVAIGFVAIGLLSFGFVALAAGAAFGLNAVAPFAIGVAAAGYWSGGLAAWGWHVLFSRG